MAYEAERGPVYMCEREEEGGEGRGGREGAKRNQEQDKRVTHMK